jgi:tetratricopeptide (TPR) repeat protein
MRLAAGAGWYWWLGGRKAEGSELITAATKLSGDVADEVRAMVYTHVVTLLTAGRSDERQAGEWIREAYRCSQSGKDRYPLLALIAPLEHMLREPGTVLSAWEPLLDDGDAWVRAMARLQLGKMRVLLGHEGPEAEAYLEAALAEFRALGERFGISFAQSELADRVAGRGEFAAACEHYEQAIEAVTEIGAVDDVIRMRSWQARLYRLLGDDEASAASIAAAERSAAGVTWPDALVELALAKAELARWSGDAEEARRQVDIVLSTLGEEAKLPNVRATTHSLLGYLADDLAEAREHFALACAAASEAGIAPMIAQVLVGIADLALRLERYEQAARLLAASAGVRGLPDRTQPDVARIELETLSRLGEAQFAEATREGAQADWNELVAEALAD